MPGISVSKFGDWNAAGVTLQNLSAKLFPSFYAQITEDGDFILETLRDHIDAQDLPWAALSPSTVAQKGHDTIYVETGFLRDSLSVRKIKSTRNGLTLFIGASPWKSHPSGAKLSDIMIWLEYGTENIPARPLVRPTWEEVAPIIQDNWISCLKDLIDKGGG